MILTRDEILKEVKFEPGLDEFQVQSCAIDLRAAETIGLGYRAHYLMRSMEKISMPKDVVGVVYPRSSLNRKKVTLDMTGIVDPGYEGQLVLPLTNWDDERAAPEPGMPVGKYKGVMIRKGERIASIVFHRISAPVEPRISKYQNSDGDYVPDKAEESAFIEAGDVDGLKRKYSL